MSPAQQEILFIQSGRYLLLVYSFRKSCKTPFGIAITKSTNTQSPIPQVRAEHHSMLLQASFIWKRAPCVGYTPVSKQSSHR